MSIQILYDWGCCATHRITGGVIGMDRPRGFDRLFAPGRIGTLQLRNRIIMPPLVTGYCTEEGFVTERLKAFHRERAKSGAGLNMVEATCVDFPRGRFFYSQMCIDGERYLPGLKGLADVIHTEGAKTAIQIHHAGRATKIGIARGQPVAPSPLSRQGFDTPRELTVPEIKEIVNLFAQGAAIAREAGFDGIELHACHDHLPAQFLSPFSNKRNDEYGGTLENRTRFLLEVIRAIRKAVGRNYPFWCRLNAETKVNGGMTATEPIEVAKMVMEAGVDAIHLSTYPTSTRPPFIPAGFLLPFAAELKKVVEVPVIVPGRISPQLGEEALKKGQADFIAFGRALITDPEYLKKVAEGRWDEIVPCIGCMICMDAPLFYPEGPATCSVNARMGYEQEYPMKPTSKPKKVMIIGGGAAGMEAARVAALRGHQVEIYERGESLGGQMNAASVAAYKEVIKEFRDYLEGQVRKLGVKVHLNREITARDVEGAKADAVIIAMGAAPAVPAISGVDKSRVMFAEDVLLGKAKVGQTVIVVGGGQVGCETAQYLADQGRNVMLVELMEELAVRASPSYRRPLLDVVAEKGIAVYAAVKSEELVDGGMVITNRRGGKETLKADTIVLASGSKPNSTLIEELKEKVKEVYVAGDCVQPRRIKEAVAEGFRAGYSV